MVEGMKSLLNLVSVSTSFCHFLLMKKQILITFLSSLALSVGLLCAQSPQALKDSKIQEAPNVKNFKALQKLNDQIVALSKKAQPATVCLISKNGRGSGSGVVVNENGLILTAAHVTANMKEGIIVIFPDGTRKEAKALGADYDRDAAMAQITEEGPYPFIEVGQSKNLKKNQWTIALGHSGGFDPMRKPPVRLGRVLANREFIVSDTAVIGGDSGGPLFDAKGKVIGIHSNIGMSLMENRHVPIEVFHQQWNDLKSGKESGRRFNNAQQNNGPKPDQPVLGIQLADAEGKVRIESVVPQSPAQKAGLQTGDLIHQINDTKTESSDALMKLIREMKVGDELTLHYHRGDESKSTKVKLVRFDQLSLSDDDRSPEESPEKKKQQPSSKEDQPKEKIEDLIRELLEKAAKNGGRLEMTPELLQKMGGMEKLMEELQRQGGMSGILPQGPDAFFASSLKALAPVAKKNQGSTVIVTRDNQMVSLGTVISANGRILTKNTETQDGKISVRIGEKSFQAKVIKRFPAQDLALLKIEANGLKPVRFKPEEPPLGSILTTVGAKNEPLGIGLLSVSGRAMSQVGFIGIRGGQSDKGVLIEQIVPKGAAAEAGLKDQDIITALDGTEVRDPIEFGNLIRGRKAGQKVTIDYLRGDQTGQVTVTLKERAMPDRIRNDPRMKLSHGQLSEKTSGYPDVIQHDIPIAPQLCGSPLLDLSGRCIGINVSRAGRTRTFAIPADEIQRILKTLGAPKRPVVKKTNPSREAIQAIRESLEQIEKRLDELERLPR